MSEVFLQVTDESFEEEVLKSDLPVLVDFWAVWCGPCKMVVPTLEYLHQNYQDKLKVVKLDVDTNQQIPAKYGIMSIPTMLLFKGGELVNTLVGALPKDKIIKAVTEHL